MPTDVQVFCANWAPAQIWTKNPVLVPPFGLNAFRANAPQGRLSSCVCESFEDSSKQKNNRNLYKIITLFETKLKSWDFLGAETKLG